LISSIQFGQFYSAWSIPFSLVSSIQSGKSCSTHLKSFFQNQRIVSDIILETNSYSETGERFKTKH